jgi:hypothetical protein
MLFDGNTIITIHEPDSNNNIYLHRKKRNFMPKGKDYVLLFQQSLKLILKHKGKDGKGLSKSTLKTFIFIISEIGFGNSLEMPGFAQRCAAETNEHRSNIAAAIKILTDLKIIIKEKIEHTNAYRYRINYTLCAKDEIEEIISMHNHDNKENQLNLFF